MEGNMRKIELIFKKGNIRAIATLLEKEAPQTCEAFWNSLPIEREAVHASWSGECIIVVPAGVRMIDRLPLENETIFVAPGEIALYPKGDELLLFYGRGQPRWRTGPTVVNVFAKIIENLEEFAKQCRKMIKTGSETLIIKRKE
jgi:hypothetical protein